MKITRPNSRAPGFALLNTNGKKVNLKSLIGKQNIILVVYRGDWCYFCRRQLKNFKDEYQEFQELNCAIYAVSVDPVEKNLALKQKLNLPFEILSDPEHTLKEKYTINIGRKNSYLPAVFIIDVKGTIRFSYIGKGKLDRPKNKRLIADLKEISG